MLKNNIVDTDSYRNINKHVLEKKGELVLKSCSDSLLYDDFGTSISFCDALDWINLNFGTKLPNIQGLNDQNNFSLDGKNLRQSFSPLAVDINYCNITKYLEFPQTVAAKKLGIPTSTLSKRWKEVAPNRNWPFRKLQKIDKEICFILKDIPPNDPVPAKNVARLALLIRKRNEELQSVFIRM